MTPKKQRNRFRRRGTLVLALLALLTTASLQGWLPFIYTPGYTPKIMTAVTAQHTTHCMGRYLVTLPSDFELITGGWGDIELYYGLNKNFELVHATVRPGVYDYESFWKDVNLRQSELKRSNNTATKSPMLLHAEQLGKVSALLRRLGDERYGLSIKTEIHAMVGKRHVVLEQESYSKDQSDISYRNANPAPAETRLKMIASKLLPYETAKHPRPGFCMQGVLFDVGQDDETAIFKFRAGNLPDTTIEVNYHAVTGQPRQGLLARGSDAYRIHPEFRSMIATLREGNANLGGAAAEESLTKSMRPVTQHNFRIERSGAELRTLDHPFFGITLLTGMPYGEGDSYHDQDDSALSDEQVLKVWDELVASVRKR